MDNQLWNPVLAGLDPVQLRQLRHKIDERLAQYTFEGDSEGHNSFDLDRATFYSNASTLYASGRSTPIASSIASDKMPSHSSAHVNVLNHSLSYSTESSAWPMYTTSNPQHHLESLDSISFPKALHETVYDPKPTELVSKQFFCTFCSELGIQKIIKTKQDWKRHEEDYHFGTGLQWICQVKGCSVVFFRGVDFKDHLKKGHEGKKLPRDCKEVRQLRRVYACGFESDENCRQLNTTWKAHCDHVAMHMSEGLTTWTYNRTIRNLLKHQSIAFQWKKLYYKLCPSLQIVPGDLTWDFRETQRMREQLEFHRFGHHSEEFFLRLFHSGVPSAIRPPLNYLASLLHTTQQANAPLLPSSIGSLDFNLSLGDIHAPLDAVDAPISDIAVTSQNNRNSVFMVHVPPFDGSGQFVTPRTDPFEEVPSMADEQISLGNFIAEIASHPLPDTVTGTIMPDHGKSHSPRALVAKSREWLVSKKSQNFQPIVTNHPDLPTNVRLPASSRRKKSYTVTPRTQDYQA